MALLTDLIPRLVNYANNSQLADTVLNTDWNHWKYQFQSYLNDINQSTPTTDANPQQCNQPESSTCNRGQNTGIKSAHKSKNDQMVNSANKLLIKLNLENFSPQEISVKVNANYILVNAEHEEKRDEFGFVARKLSRRIEIADDVDRDSIASHFSGGVLIIEANKKVIIDSDGSRVIPVVIEKSGSSEDMNLD